MKLKSLLKCTVLTVFALPAYAEETRELESHEHGHGALNIAVEGDQIAMELEVPGFDIVGFEYAAESDADKAAVELGLAALGDPFGLFTVPADAGCEVTEASVELHGDEGHNHDKHADGEDHDDHADGDKHDEHAEGEDHADHDHDESAEDEKHDDHDHEDHAEAEASHSEFHAEYVLTCAAIDAVKTIELTYFEVFPNAEELDVQLVTGAGAASMEATREAPVLDLGQAM